MKNHTFILTPLIALSLFWGGCANEPGPRTQEGATGGAIIGALGGAMIGNNSGGGNGGSGALVGAIAGALIGGAMGNESDQREAYQQTPERHQSTTIFVAEPPPTPSMPSEIIPNRPSADAVWVGGYWIYNSNDRYEWAPGRWEIPPPRCRSFVPPHWARQGNGYVYMHGYWRI